MHTSVCGWCDFRVLGIFHGSGALELSRASEELWGLSHGHRRTWRRHWGHGWQTYRLPTPSTYNGSPSEWEEWSWNFKAYISMFGTSAIRVLDRVEERAEPIQDEDLATTLDTGHPDVEASRQAVTFSRCTTC